MKPHVANNNRIIKKLMADGWVSEIVFNKRWNDRVTILSRPDDLLKINICVERVNYIHFTYGRRMKPRYVYTNSRTSAYKLIKSIYTNIVEMFLYDIDPGLMKMLDGDPYFVELVGGLMRRNIRFYKHFLSVFVKAQVSMDKQIEVVKVIQ